MKNKTLLLVSLLALLPFGMCSAFTEDTSPPPMPDNPGWNAPEVSEYDIATDYIAIGTEDATPHLALLTLMTCKVTVADTSNGVPIDSPVNLTAFYAVADFRSMSQPPKEPTPCYVYRLFDAGKQRYSLTDKKPIKGFTFRTARSSLRA